MGLENVRQAQREEQTQGYKRYQQLEEKLYDGRTGDESQYWIDAPNIRESYAFYTQRHGAPFHEWVSTQEHIAIVKYNVQNTNNPYVLMVTTIAWDLTQEELR